MSAIRTDQGPDLAAKARLFHGLADPSRLALLEELREGPLHVGALVRRTGLTQSNASNHLACLLGCGLVTREPRGRRAIYALRPGQVEAILSSADRLLGDVAEQMRECVGAGEGAPEAPENGPEERTDAGRAGTGRAGARPGESPGAARRATPGVPVRT